MTDSWQAEPCSVCLDHPGAKPILPYCISGVFLRNTVTGEELVASIIPTILLSMKNDPKLEILITTQSLIDKYTVSWTTGHIDKAERLTELDEFHSKLISSGFEFLPDLNRQVNSKLADIVNTDDPQQAGLRQSSLYAIIIRPNTPIYPHIVFNRKEPNLRPIQLISDSPTLKPAVSLICYSSPFCLANPALFTGYVSTGTMSYRLPSSVGYLTDLRYLEGMEGGLVAIRDISELRPLNDTRKPLKSIGLVAGEYRKSSGEGDLTLIVPWSSIFPQMVQPHHPSIPSEPKLKANFTRSVLAVTTRASTGNLIWGSAVLISPTMLVTNHHVASSSKHRVHVWFSNRQHAEAQVLPSPVKGLDVTFLQLSSPVPSYHVPAIVDDSPDCFQPGTPVVSVGFGILSPLDAIDEIAPIVSRGVISCSISRDVQLQDTQLKSTPVLSIASAGCWNGSSGGGVFTSNGLIGLMASNGKNEQTGQIYPFLAMNIPLYKLLPYCLEVFERRKRGEKISDEVVDKEVTQLWDLQSIHKQKVIRESKL